MSELHPINVKLKKQPLKTQIEILSKPKIAFKCCNINIKNEDIEFINYDLVIKNKMLARHLYGSMQVICVAIILSQDIETIYSGLSTIDKKSFEHLVKDFSVKYIDDHINGFTYKTAPWLLYCEQFSFSQFRNLNSMLAIESNLSVNYLDVKDTKVRFFIGLIGIQESVPKVSKCSLCFNNSKCTGLCKV